MMNEHDQHFEKHENVFENDSECIHFGPHMATLGAKMLPNVSLRVFQKEYVISDFFATRLGAKLTQKGIQKGTDSN